MKHRHSGNTSDKIFMIVNHLLAFLFLVICLYPMYFILIASVSNVGMVTGGEVFLLPKGLTTAGYRMLMEKKEIWVGYKNTILYTLFGTMFNLALTIPAGYALSIRTLPFRRGLNFLFLVTMFISGGMIPTYLLVNHLSLIHI